MSDGADTIAIWANIILFVIVGLIAISMVRFHNNELYKNFNLIDLITCKEGKISRPAFLEMGAFLVLTWAVIVEVNRDNFDQWLAGVYISAFVLRAAYSSFLSSKNEGKEVK